jgi:hypothetical protein
VDGIRSGAIQPGIGIDPPGGEPHRRGHDAARSQNLNSVGIAEQKTRTRLNQTADARSIGAAHQIQDRLLAISLNPKSLPGGH